MKTVILLVALVSSLCACTATVRTYDSAGQQTGKCEAHRAWFFGGAICVGNVGVKP